jgi:chloramphenicol O-acetyltransferase type A
VGAFIDLRTWKRRDHYQLFRRYQQPFFSVTVDVDVTGVWNRCRKPQAPSFFLVSLFLLLRAVNDVEAFRLRLRPRGVWRHDRVAVGPTIRRPDDTFGFARFEPADTLDEFVNASTAATSEAMTTRVLGQYGATASRDDIIYHSVLPWFRFTAFANALPGRDSIPRIVFGRVAREGGRMKMPVAVEVHHAVVDGADVGKFFDRYGQQLENASVFR